MNIVSGTLTGVGPGACWRIGPDEAASNHCIAVDMRNGTLGDVAHTLQAAGIGSERGGNHNAIPQILAYGGNNTSGPIAVATACRAKGGNGHGDFESETFVAHTTIPFGATQLTSQKNYSNPKPGVRRLTPTECERLMGFPDGYTAITHRGKPAADGPRYKALGNSWAVNCARWVGYRISTVDSLNHPQPT